MGDCPQICNLKSAICKAAGEVLTAKQALTGPASPRRSVCAPDALSLPL
jgi:hypothetical protein